MKHLTTKGITATVASVMTVSALQAGGIPVLEGLAIAGGCVFVGIAIKRQFKRQDQVGESSPMVEPAAIEQPDYNSISILVFQKMLDAMDKAGTTDHAQLMEVAKQEYESLGLPYRTVADFVLVAVIRWCVNNGHVPFPFPASWNKYQNMFKQCFDDVTDVSWDVSERGKNVSKGDQERFKDVSEHVPRAVSNVIQLSTADDLLAAMAVLKSELGEKAKGAYSLYGDWIKCLSTDLLRVRVGREWLKGKDKSLTVKQADALIKVFKLKALRAGLLLPNPEYKGKPPYPEYLITKITTNTRAAYGE